MIDHVCGIMQLGCDYDYVIMIMWLWLCDYDYVIMIVSTPMISVSGEQLSNWAGSAVGDHNDRKASD